MALVQNDANSDTLGTENCIHHSSIALTSKSSNFVGESFTNSIGNASLRGGLNVILILSKKYDKELFNAWFYLHVCKRAKRVHVVHPK